MALQPPVLFSLASRHAQWASARQAAIAGNIANANTPGYKAMDTQAFSAVLDKTGASMTRTATRHMDAPQTSVGTNKSSAKGGWETSTSGNTVSLEQEMLKADEVQRAFSLNNAVVRSFNRMLLSSVKS